MSEQDQRSSCGEPAVFLPARSLVSQGQLLAILQVLTVNRDVVELLKTKGVEPELMVQVIHQAAFVHSSRLPALEAVVKAARSFLETWQTDSTFGYQKKEADKLSDALDRLDAYARGEKPR